MCDGSQKAIVDVQEGEWVLSRDDRTGALTCGQVVQPTVNPDQMIVELELVNGAGLSNVVETTDNHPFWVNEQGWTRVDQLQLGSEIVAADDELLTVTRIYRTDRVEGVYNFSVPDFRSYFVGEEGAWVHNCFKFNSLSGKSHRYIRDRKPKGWQEVRADNGKGWKWLDKSGKERLRFMRPQKGEVKWQRQKNGYMRWRNRNGDYLDADGSPVPKTADDFHQRTHITYEGIWP